MSTRNPLLKAACALLLVMTAMPGLPAQEKERPINQDESLVEPYTLPDPLLMEDGRKVRNSKDWVRKRRPELMELFRSQMYGREPCVPSGMHFKVVEESPDAFFGLATRRQVEVFLDKEEQFSFTMLMYIPNDRKGPVPFFVGENFKGNHATTTDPAVLLPSAEKEAGYGPKYQRVERGAQAMRWPYEYILTSGYGVATFCYHEIDPDFHDGFHNGVHGLMDDGTPRGGDSWATISAWAWGLSRAMDYLQTDPDVDAAKVAVVGHSRLGKTALWAAATDTRFAAAFSSCSGCSGAALSRRKFGETVAAITRNFPHWFCGNYREYRDREEDLPFDQHELLAMIAPRPVYVSSADDDLWADPKGEYLSLVGAAPVYALFGIDGFTDPVMPEVESPRVAGRMGHHVRHGSHNILLYDWQQYIPFIDRFFKSDAGAGKPSGRKARKEAPKQELWPDGTPMSPWFSDASKVDPATLGKRYVITEHGVSKDPTLVQTRAIQAVIDKASADGGGLVVIPPGTFLSGSLFFKEGTSLYLEEGARLKGSDRIEDFPVVDTRIEGQNCRYFPALVNADGVDGFVIAGKGTVDGNGLNYWKEFWIRRSWNPECTNKDAQRPRLLFVSNSRNVTIQDVHFKDSPFWTTHVYKCSFVRYLDCSMTAPKDGVPAPSSDAIDIDACTDVLVKGCYMSVNDDAVVLKGGRGTWADTMSCNGPNERILVEDCDYGYSHGCITMGSESIHDRNVILRNCTIGDGERLLWLKMRTDTPQIYEYITVSNITGKCKRVVTAWPWSQFQKLEDRPGMPRSSASHIRLEGIRVACDKFLDITESPQYTISLAP